MSRFIRSAFIMVFSLFIYNNALGQLTVDEPEYQVFNTFDIPPNLTSSLGTILFSADGNTVWILDESEDSDSSIWTATVTRDAQGNVTAFGAFSEVFEYDYMDTGLEFGPSSDTMFFYVYDGGIGQRLANGTVEVTAVSPYDDSYGGVAFIPGSYPNGGSILHASYDDGQVYIHAATPDGDGSFTVNGTGTLYADFSVSIGTSTLGDIIVITNGPLAGNVMMAIYDLSGMTLAYFPIGADGLPVGGTTPTPQTFASGDLGTWGVAFDPVTGNIWAVDYDSSDVDALYQISGPALSPTGPLVPVPTLTGISLALLSLMLLGVVALRRRRII